MVDDIGEDEMIKLDGEFLKKVRGPMQQVWQAIAPDVDECDGNDEAIEMVLDANRLSMFLGAPGKEVEELIAQAEKDNGFEAVDEFLCSNVHLY
jgi:hypothetical protein